MKFPARIYLLFNQLRHAWQAQREDSESRFLSLYGHPNAAEYLFIRHLYDTLPCASGRGERFLSFQDRYNYVAMYPPHIWDCDGDIGIDRGGFRVVTMDHGYALALVNGPASVTDLNIARAIETFMTDLSGPDWARALELIIDNECHFLAPMFIGYSLVEHYLETFYPQAIATGQQSQEAVPAPAPTVLVAEATPMMTVDLELIGKIDQQDVWI